MGEQLRKPITDADIEAFINGEDPFERIVNITYRYQNDFMSVYYRNEKDKKDVVREPFLPFLWATRRACNRLCDGNKEQLKDLMRRYGIGVKRLSNTNIEGKVIESFNDGYLFMFFAKKPMTYANFQNFFKKAGNPIYTKDRNDKFTKDDDKDKQYLVVTPIEQFLISTGKRFFKGYNDYDDLLRMTFDLETTGLDTEKDRIVQLGVRMNRPFSGRPDGFEKIFTVTGDTEEEKDRNELKVIRVFFKMIAVFEPDIVCGHNIENFDLNMIIGACKRLGTTMEAESARYFNGESAKKEERETVLKLGGEIETYHATTIPNTITTDSLHAVRRAQAINSNILKADLKYITEFSGMKKENRVYTPGDKISEIWADKTHQYAFNEKDGDWYIYDPESKNDVKDREEFTSDAEYNSYIKSIKSKQDDKPFKLRTRNKLIEGYEIKTGQYIVERYLFDDLYEGDRVEWKFNSSAFSICKALPVPYKKCTTMGTAGQWKALMLAWSYKRGLAIPPLVDTGSFTGGLSRLICSGFVQRIAKYDYSGLYPSLELDWGINDENDLDGIILKFLNYFLVSRKALQKKSKEYGKIEEKMRKAHLNGELSPEEEETYLSAKRDASTFDSLQLTRKIFCNSNFGSLSATKGVMFPWKSLKCGEQITCTGRQCLRLLIYHFSNISTIFGLNDPDYNYHPIVGDSVTGDTPLFIKYKDSGLIDIKPIEEIVSWEHLETDELGREYDATEKPFLVLCRNGWEEVKYLYCHRTNKPIYRVEDGETVVDVTEDHSLFDQEKNEIKPSEIGESTKLEYYDGEIGNKEFVYLLPKDIVDLIRKTEKGEIDRVPVEILNANEEDRKLYLKSLNLKEFTLENKSKTFMAGINYIKRGIELKVFEE